LALAQDIERRYRALGGEIHYQSRVEKILVENDRAVGVRLSDGAEYRADVVISAADGHTTLFKMLEGKYVNAKLQGYYDRWPIFPPIVQVSLGIKRDLAAMPHTLLVMLETPVLVAGKERQQIGLRHFCYDPTLAPAGKSVVTSMFASNHAYWQTLAADRAQYAAEKQRAAAAVIAALDRRYPGIAADVEVVDVATPLTTARYTGNWQGPMKGWLITPENIGMIAGKGMGQTLPGLENFYMAGQWVEPGGGVPTAAMSGRKLIRKLCKRDKRKFVAALV
jgi:phytoene dehydrogenase-like protein